MSDWGCYANLDVIVNKFFLLVSLLHHNNSCLNTIKGTALRDQVLSLGTLDWEYF